MASAVGKSVEESDFCGRHRTLAEGTVLRIGVVPSPDLSLQNVLRGLLESMRPPHRGSRPRRDAQPAGHR
jgi:hypothetical protein